MENTDKRVIYTKNVIQRSILELLRQKPISRISVTEISARAGVNRGTFYAHFTDPYDLYSQIENSLFDQLRTALTRHGQSDLKGAILDVVNVLKLNSATCAAIFGEYGNMNIITRVSDMGQDLFIANWGNKVNADRDTLENIFAFICAGCVAIIRKWVNEDMVKTPESVTDTLYGIAGAILDEFAAKAVSARREAL